MNEQEFIGVIPSRFASTRFPGKPLVDILGKTMIQRVYEQALKSKFLSRVIVATDDERISKEVTSFGGIFEMTDESHQSGTDRCAEVARRFSGNKNTIVINIQGDEPFIEPDQIDELCQCFIDPHVNLATLTTKFTHVDEVLNPNSIKVVKDQASYALYFSRLPIPYFRDKQTSNDRNLNFYHKHIGIYGYRTDILQKIARLEESFLEKSEKLEQLRWLENGFRIMTAESNHLSISIDTPDDLKNVISRFT